MPVEPDRWLDDCLRHTRHAARLSQALLRCGGDRVVVIAVPLPVAAAPIAEERVDAGKQAAE